MKIVYLIGSLIVMLGVILVYDARPITKKVFSFGDQNEGSLGLKIVGYIIAIIGAILIYVL